MEKIEKQKILKFFSSRKILISDAHLDELGLLINQHFEGGPVAPVYVLIPEEIKALQDMLENIHIANNSST